MSKSKTLTARRKRRRAKAQMGNHKAVRKHARKAGRTGNIQAKRTPGKTRGYSHTYPNPPVLIEGLGR